MNVFLLVCICVYLILISLWFLRPELNPDTVKSAVVQQVHSVTVERPCTARTQQMRNEEQLCDVQIKYEHTNVYTVFPTTSLFKECIVNETE